MPLAAAIGAFEGCESSDGDLGRTFESSDDARHGCPSEAFHRHLEPQPLIPTINDPTVTVKS